VGVGVYAVHRPIFLDIVEISDSMLVGEKDDGTKKADGRWPKNENKIISTLMNRHSTWL